MAFVRNPVVYVPDLTNGRPIVDGKVYLLTAGTVPPTQDSAINPADLLVVSYVNEAGNTVTQPQPLYTSKGGCLYGSFPQAAAQYSVNNNSFVFAAYNAIGELQYSAETTGSDYVETDALAAINSTVLVGGVEAGEIADLTVGVETDQGASFIKTKPSYLGSGSEQGDLQTIANEIVLAKMVGLGTGADDSQRLTDFIAQSGPCELIFSRGMECLINLAVINNSERLTLSGNGAKIRLAGNSPDGLPTGMRVTGTARQLKIRGFEIYSQESQSNIVAFKHVGFWTPSGTEIDDLEISDFNYHDLMNGISVNTNTGGFQKNVRIFNGVIKDIYGTESGQGYGLHRADGSGLVDSAFVAHHINIFNCQRHAIYQARGKHFSFHDINIFGHREGVATQQFRPAINCIRSEAGELRNIRGYNIFDCFLNIEKASIVCDDITADKLKVYGIGNAVPPFKVGAADPTANDPDTGNPVGAPGRVTLRDCHAEYSGINVDPYRIYNAEYLTVEDCTAKVSGITATAAMFDLYGSGETSGTANFSKKWIFRNNQGSIDPDQATYNTRIYRLRDTFSTSGIELFDDYNGGEYNDVIAYSAIPITNPNITSTSPVQTGWADVVFNANYYNGIKLRFGTRTVSHSSIAVNVSSVSAPTYTVNGIKAGDPVQVNFSAIGSLNLIISAQTIADNQVRVCIHNPSTVSNLTIPAGSARFDWMSLN